MIFINVILSPNHLVQSYMFHFISLKYVVKKKVQKVYFKAGLWHLAIGSLVFFPSERHYVQTNKQSKTISGTMLELSLPDCLIS